MNDTHEQSGNPDLTRDICAGHAAEALKAHAISAGTCVQDDVENFTDLLNDLRHYADAKGIDFDKAVGVSLKNYLMETIK